MSFLALGGCLDSLPAPAIDAPDAPDEEPLPPGMHVSSVPPLWRPNVWLLDGLRPPSTEVSGGAEPTILASKDGSTLWIGDTSGLWISTDNGTTWDRGARPFLNSADGWTLAEDDDGRFYFATTTAQAVSLARSRDGGRTADHVEHIVDASPIADRPWIAARGDGEVVLVVFDWGRTFSESCARSQDGGETWLDRGVLTAIPNVGNVIFDKDGNFYVGEEDGGVVRFAGSCGLTRSIDMFPGSLGANGMLQVKEEDGRLYMAAAGPANREILLSGKDGWSGQLRQLTVSPPALYSNAYPVLSVHNGRIAVAWYGSETAGNPSSPSYAGTFNVYLAIVDHFWTDTPSIQHVRLTAEPNHVGDICMSGATCSTNSQSDRDLLDYFGIDHDIWGGVHVAYGHDGATSRRSVRFAHVLPDIVELPPVPAPDLLDQPPEVWFSVAEDDLRVRVDASASSDPEGGNLSFVWSWGDGRPSSTGVRASHSYTRMGAYAINLTVADIAGNIVHREHRFIVGDEDTDDAPVADFSFGPAWPAPGANVTFNDRSFDTEDDIVWRQWDFGDGSTSSEESPIHTFLLEGSYRVQLRVEDSWGQSGSVERTVQVVAEQVSRDALAAAEADDGRATPVAGWMALMAIGAAAWTRRGRRR